MEEGPIIAGNTHPQCIEFVMFLGSFTSLVLLVRADRGRNLTKVRLWSSGMTYRYCSSLGDVGWSIRLYALRRSPGIFDAVELFTHKYPWAQSHMLRTSLICTQNLVSFDGLVANNIQICGEYRLFAFVPILIQSLSKLGSTQEFLDARPIYGGIRDQQQTWDIHRRSYW